MPAQRKLKLKFITYECPCCLESRNPPFPASPITRTIQLLSIGMHPSYSREAGTTRSWAVALKHSIKQFTPAWYAIVMGTGAISILFDAFPYGSGHHGLQITAFCFLILNVLFFILITAFTIARYILFPGLWSSMLRHRSQGLYLGCFPMGFATILIAAVNIVYGYFGLGGSGFIYALWGMWWVDIAVTVVLCFGQMHIMFTRQTHSLSCMTMVWLLPIVTVIVISAAGGVIAQSLLPLNKSHVCLTLAVCTLLVTIGITLSFAVIAIYILRLVVYKIPEGIAVFSVFLALGPLGQAGFTYLVLGEVAGQVFPLAGESGMNVFANAYTPHVLYVLGWIVGFALWSCATCWIVLGIFALSDRILSILSKNVDAIPFKITFWGMIFPNGVYANLTIHLANTTNSQILRVWGTIYAIFTLCLWLFAFTRTIFALRDGTVFEELCDVTEEQAEIPTTGAISEVQVDERRNAFTAPVL